MRQATKKIANITFFAISTLILSTRPAFSVDDIDPALQKRGNPPSLMFLKELKLAPRLMRAISRDISSLPPEEALRRITDRLRLELIGTGVLRLPTDSDNSSSMRSVATLQAASSSATGDSRLPGYSKSEDGDGTLLRFRNAARKSNLDETNPGLRTAFPSEQVLASAYTVFRPSTGLEQTTPGIAVDPAPVIPSDRPSTNSSSGRSVEIGSVPTQTLPGTPDPSLLQCDTPFDKLATPGCVKNGQRCETFSRWQFGEVVEVTTPAGGTCSGTLITDRWILSAAHCFIPDESAEIFKNKSNDRHDSAGNAVLQFGDLQHTAVYARYADSENADSYKQVDKVVVDPNWDPFRVIQDGVVIEVAGKTVRADWVYPHDLALIKLVDADAIESVTPAKLPNRDYVGVITTAGYGVTTVGDGRAGDLWVTWPSGPVRSANTELELDQVGTTNISTFCVGDSGGPAFEGRNRGCRPSDGEARPRTLIGVTSHYYGQRAASGDTAIQDADFCMGAPISRFMNMATPAYRNWVCAVTSGSALGCS